MNQIQSDLDRIASTVQILADFVGKYGEKIPDGLATIALGAKPSFTIDLDFASPEDRERALAIVGDILGRNGWEAKQSTYKYNSINWMRDIAGVACRIDGAEMLPPIMDHLVDPKEFPLMLEGGV